MTTPTREIKYDRDSRDYACYLDGDLVCYARTYTEGETTLDALMLELIQAESYVAAQVAEVVEPIEVHACPDCGGDWDREQCQVCGWTAKPLVLARPGEVAELVYSARPVAPHATDEIEARTPCAPVAPDEPQSDRPDVAPYRCPDCGDPVEAQEQQCRACREDAGVVDPTHCAHLEACATSSCAACEPRWRSQTGRSMVCWLNDDLPAFLVFFASLSEPNKAETYAAIAQVSENTPADVATFLSRSRARANALGML